MRPARCHKRLCCTPLHALATAPLHALATAPASGAVPPGACCLSGDCLRAHVQPWHPAFRVPHFALGCVRGCAAHPCQQQSCSCKLRAQAPPPPSLHHSAAPRTPLIGACIAGGTCSPPLESTSAMRVPARRALRLHRAVGVHNKIPRAAVGPGPALRPADRNQPAAPACAHPLWPCRPPALTRLPYDRGVCNPLLPNNRHMHVIATRSQQPTWLLQVQQRSRGVLRSTWSA